MINPVTAALEVLVGAVEAALDDPGHADDRARADAMRPAMAALLADPEPIPAWAEEPYGGAAVGNLLHTDGAGRFHVLAVVFPQGTSSGVHHHGCWGVIGYLRGGDEETRFVERGGAPVEASRHVWHRGDVTDLLPEEGEGWHRVRNPGPGIGVSVHVLCRTSEEVARGHAFGHPHRFYDKRTGLILDYPFVEVAPDRWSAQVVLTGDVRP